MLAWMLLVSLFCKSMQDGHRQDNGVLACEPHSLTLNNTGQVLLLTWKEDPSCSAVNETLVYDLVVLRADKQVHEDEFTVMPDKIGTTHNWTWTSDLPLECASHSVRIRSRYKKQKSQWELERTLPGVKKSTELQLYPQDLDFLVGSIAKFCCVLPAGRIFETMFLEGYDGRNMNTTKISNETYVLTAYLNQPSSLSCTNVRCETNMNDEAGACAYIGYPPGDKDLECETQDLESVRCHWTVGIKTRLRSPTAYQLNGRPCEVHSKGVCEQKIQGDERTWNLTAKNNLGKVELIDSEDIRKRVRMFAPKKVAVLNVNARNVSLNWRWKGQYYNNLSIKCQVEVSHGVTRTTNERFGVGLKYAVVNDLIPNSVYNVLVRCGTTQDFWKWSDWSTRVSFRTKGDVPDALDVWMQMMDYQVLIVWKEPLANQSHGNITDYTVTWGKTTEIHQQNTATVPPNKHCLPLNLDTTEEYNVTVAARNINGSSSLSAITILRNNTDGARVNTSLITGSNGSFSLSWSASPNATCGYIVDWCPTSGDCIVEWLRLPPQETKARIFSKNFKDGVRYSLSIYACTHGPPVLLERREGYVSEKRMKDNLFGTLKLIQQEFDVVVSWRSIPPIERTAFIFGYILYWSENNNKDQKVFSVRTDDPEATSLVAKNLNISSYTFTVEAMTALGECGTTVQSFTLNSLTDSLIVMVSISLVLVFCFLSLFTILCYRHWACIRQKLYPPIPKPVLTDKWLTSPNEHNRCVDQHHKREADVLDFPELLCKSGAPVYCLDSQKNPTPNDYYNTLNKNTPPPTTTTPSQSRLPPSTLTGVFPNPSYNLIIQTADQQSNSEPQVQEAASLDWSGIEYQPQSPNEIFTLNQEGEIPDSPLVCVTTYMLLPQSPSQ
ncbi:leukemia inhibitory factor receptor-like isoform X1 [Channa argus]|uniref:leukemia inhibitory factor receptor-like isoform X1 n=2 Tax=Channa argus TaxID=215402 RepID=UPI0029481588|nr:hypothetical protein Q8A73_020065 [Channa argus]